MGNGDQAGGNGGGGTARGTAGVVGGVVRVHGGPFDGVIVRYVCFHQPEVPEEREWFGDEIFTQTQLMHIRFPDDNGAGIFEFLDAPGRAAVLPGVVDPGGETLFVAVKIGLILDGYGNTIQRAQGLTGFIPCGGGFGRG